VTEVTRILSAIGQGDSGVAEQLLPLVSDDLRRLAAQKLAQEKPGQTLQVTALVHEAYMRLVGSGETAAGREPRWDSRGHFFAAAAEAMRRILIDPAREKSAEKRGRGRGAEA
jgi:RNA polymerase sigma factor (TIGR02999 family)